MFNGDIKIKETSIEDLENVARLWNDGEVMFYVGFPEGIGTNAEKLEKWLKWAISKPNRCHYSVYAEGIGYCGESFYDVDEAHKAAALDIKIFKTARGKGIANKALSFAIKKAFEEGGAEVVYVDPHPDNKKAWALYEKLGFESKPRPEYLEEGDTYLELTREKWFSEAVLIREYTAMDWKRINEIHDAARIIELEQADLMGAYLTLEETYENEELFESTILVAEVDKQVEGFIGFRDDEITWMYVNPKTMGRGIGKAMIKAAIEKCGQVISLDVLYGNTRAKKFYEGIGFVEKELRSGKLAGNESFSASAYIMEYRK